MFFAASKYSVDYSMFLTAIECIRRCVFDHDVLFGVREAFKSLRSPGSTVEGGSRSTFVGAPTDNSASVRHFTDASTPESARLLYSEVDTAESEAVSKIRLLRLRLKDIEAEKKAAVADAQAAKEKTSRRLRGGALSRLPQLPERSAFGQRILL